MASAPRLHLLQMDDPVQDRALLEGADLVVAGLGYRPVALPLLDVSGEPIALLADHPGGVLVGPRSGVLDASGDEIPGLFGIGLAAGFRPGPSMGGEPSFTGQVNGLWLWQNDVGVALVDRLLEHIPGTRQADVISRPDHHDVAQRDLTRPWKAA